MYLLFCQDFIVFLCTNHLNVFSLIPFIILGILGSTWISLCFERFIAPYDSDCENNLLAALNKTDISAHVTLTLYQKPFVLFINYRKKMSHLFSKKRKFWKPLRKKCLKILKIHMMEFFSDRRNFCHYWDYEWFPCRCVCW